MTAVGAAGAEPADAPAVTDATGGPPGLPSALADLTTIEIGGGRPGRSPLLVVPLGSTEQHGAHLPLGTDTTIAVAVAERVAARIGPAVVAPPVAIGASGEHAGFPGTLSVGNTVLEEMLVELARSADHFAGIVWVNAHGGNGAALRRAQDRLLAEGRRAVVAPCAFRDADAHAGRTETSVMMALTPGAVRLDLMAPGELRDWSEIAEAVRAGGVIAVSPSGVLGDPRGASAEEGDELMAELVERLVRLVGDAVARWSDV